MPGSLLGVVVGYPIAAGVGMAVSMANPASLGFRDVVGPLLTGWFFALPILPLSVPAIVASAVVGASAAPWSRRFGFLVFALAGAALGGVAAGVSAVAGFNGMTWPAVSAGASAAIALRCVGLWVRRRAA